MELAQQLVEILTDLGDIACGKGRGEVAGQGHAYELGGDGVLEKGPAQALSDFGVGAATAEGALIGLVGDGWANLLDGEVAVAGEPRQERGLREVLGGGQRAIRQERVMVVACNKVGVGNAGALH